MILMAKRLGMMLSFVGHMVMAVLIQLREEVDTAGAIWLLFEMTGTNLLLSLYQCTSVSCASLMTLQNSYVYKTKFIVTNCLCFTATF